MWIRNQDRTILMDCDSFAVEDHSGKYEVITLNCRTSISISLGLYSTKEKALKILDQICSLLGANKFDISGLSIVFTMPQDDEV